MGLNSHKSEGKMDYAHRQLSSDVIERNLELVLALSKLPPIVACDRLAEIGRDIDNPDSNGPKVFSRDDFRAIQDAFGLAGLHEVQRPL